jgi:diguanylate cyclase (GGDEF)-like protein
LGAGPLRVLIVEDDDEFATLVARMFLRAFEGELAVARASSLGEALRHVDTLTYDAIVTDLALPDAAQLGAVHELCAAAPSTPIVVLSSHLDERLVVQAVQAGAQDYLLKTELGEFTLRRAIRHALERQQLTQELIRLAHNDALTGLANRTQFSQLLERALGRSRRSGAAIAVMVLDLDHFKDVNDVYGHAVGDRLLRAVADALRSALREVDAVARLGGDEFAAILEDIKEPACLLEVGERAIAAIAAIVDAFGARVEVGASAGFAMSTDGAITAELLVRHADIAMYQAKQAGRNQCRVFDRGLLEQQRRRRQTHSELRDAVEVGAFELHYQAIATVTEGAIVGAEALLRWNHPERGLVTAGSFVSLLEDQGLMHTVGDLVLAQACATLARWQARGLDLTLAINISPTQLQDPRFASRLEARLAAAAIAPSRLCLDVAEDLVMQRFTSARRALEACAALGVSIAIDNFGAGCSSLASLRHAPVRVLKIDQSVAAGAGGEELVSAVVMLGHALGCRVIAEGIESPAQLEALARLGCDYFQGYLARRPLPLAEFEAGLDART